MDYSLTVDGEVVDSSEGSEPIEFIQGHGNIIPGLENALYGMSIGDQKSISVSPDEGYGIYDPEAVLTVQRVEFPDEIPMELGTEVSIQDEGGDVMVAVIESFDNETVTLNGNHPLAGKDLQFDVTIVGLRQPTAEELGTRSCSQRQLKRIGDCDGNCSDGSCKLPIIQFRTIPTADNPRGSVLF